ncbi:hypothetical protein [Sinosporangium siamense]|uniref:Uncharacterized protein n=1 Tax=Sinosporangium siamense TaxID=1367973 RepID=A0A919V6M6_9ACTN|nr:hypothetical protein [Sinosporangium siamense]GII94230.1 hypothetical protein Ssi02_44610 [Sinosporangium siamense]
MPQLPDRPDLAQLRRQATELLRAAQAGEDAATSRLAAITEHPTLNAAQPAIARDYGFTNWAKLKAEVERRDILNQRDLTRLQALLAAHPEQARQSLRNWCDPPARGQPARRHRDAALQRRPSGRAAASAPARLLDRLVGRAHPVDVAAPFARRIARPVAVRHDLLAQAGAVAGVLVQVAAVPRQGRGRARRSGAADRDPGGAV